MVALAGDEIAQPCHGSGDGRRWCGHVWFPAEHSIIVTQTGVHGQ